MLTIMWIPVLIQFATLLLAAVVAAATRSYLAAMLLVMIGMIAALVVAAYRSYQFWPMALVQADHPAAECRTGYGTLQGNDGRS